MQRDIAWADAPAPVRAAAGGAADAFTPARVIESTQEDGTIIYELAGINEDVARRALARIAYKLPMACRFVTRRPTL